MRVGERGAIRLGGDSSITNTRTGIAYTTFGAATDQLVTQDGDVFTVGAGTYVMENDNWIELRDLKALTFNTAGDGQVILTSTGNGYSWDAQVCPSSNKSYGSFVAFRDSPSGTSVTFTGSLGNEFVFDASNLYTNDPTDLSGSIVVNLAGDVNLTYCIFHDDDGEGDCAIKGGPFDNIYITDCTFRGFGGQYGGGWSPRHQIYCTNDQLGADALIQVQDSTFGGLNDRQAYVDWGSQIKCRAARLFLDSCTMNDGEMSSNILMSYGGYLKIDNCNIDWDRGTESENGQAIRWADNDLKAFPVHRIETLNDTVITNTGATGTTVGIKGDYGYGNPDSCYRDDTISGFTTEVDLGAIPCNEFPSWYPAWQSPGVIKEIPASTLSAAITANGWTEPQRSGADHDPCTGGRGWPQGLYAFSGGTVAYKGGYPYLCVCGGGHATHGDNSIYAFGPLFGPGSDTPSWSRLGPQTSGDIMQAGCPGSPCPQRYSDGRPASRHTMGDFSYGAGYILMGWANSPYCGPGEITDKTDVFDVENQEWDQAKTPSITHPDSGLNYVSAHNPSCYHAYDGLFYAKGKGGAGDFGSYNRSTKTWADLGFSGYGTEYDSGLITMGPRNYVYFFKHGGNPCGRINTQTGAGESWAALPGSAGSAAAYDSVQDRIYTPLTGNHNGDENMPSGSKNAAWFDASASSSPSWNTQAFNGDTPDQQTYGRTFGRWSFIPELKGFVLNNSYNSSVYFYRTSN